MKTHWRPTQLQSGRKCLIPADRQTEAELNSWDKRVRAGELRCPRNPKFHRLAHAIGSLAADNLDTFTGMDGHQVLKRLQLESGTACDEMAIKAGGHMFLHRIPRSLSFSSMAQDEFRDVMYALCSYLVREYWPQTTVDEVVQMAEQWERNA